MKNCDEHVVGISDKHMQHNEKMIVKYVLTFGLDDIRNLFPCKTMNHTHKRRVQCFIRFKFNKKKLLKGYQWKVVSI
jgi:hypothetical protein